MAAWHACQGRVGGFILSQGGAAAINFAAGSLCVLCVAKKRPELIAAQSKGMYAVA